MIFKLILEALKMLRNANPLILASATAFFATFSISPIIIILISILSLYYKYEQVNRNLFLKIQATFGKQAAIQIQSIVDNFKELDTNGLITMVGFVFLLFVSTTLLMVVQQSIHQLWHISLSPNLKLGFNIFERIKGLAIILSIGLLFIVSQILDTGIALVQDYFEIGSKQIAAWVLQLINTAFSIFVFACWFTLLFKFLPDAYTRWRIASKGATLTAVFICLGKYVLGKVLIYSNVVTIFGASASFALILLFIFYASFIVYFGACFTYVYGAARQMPILPGRYANTYEQTITS